MGDLTGVLSETIRGARVVQAYGAEGWESNRFSEVNERTFRLAKKGARVMAFASPLVESASVLTFLLLLGYASTPHRVREDDARDVPLVRRRARR